MRQCAPTWAPLCSPFSVFASVLAPVPCVSFPSLPSLSVWQPVRTCIMLAPSTKYRLQATRHTRHYLSTSRGEKETVCSPLFYINSNCVCRNYQHGKVQAAMLWNDFLIFVLFSGGGQCLYFPNEQCILRIYSIFTTLLCFPNNSYTLAGFEPGCSKISAWLFGENEKINEIERPRVRSPPRKPLKK
jgi:hypothetical protein